MTIYVQRRTSDHVVVAYGRVPFAAAQDGSEQRSVDDDQLASLQSAGAKVLDDEGEIAVTPPTPPVVTTVVRTLPEIMIQTTGDTPTGIASFPLEAGSLYVAQFDLLAVDTGNHNRHLWSAIAMATRLDGGAVYDGISLGVDVANDDASDAWSFTVTPSGNSIAVLVTGQSGRTIRWYLTNGSVKRRVLS